MTSTSAPRVAVVGGGPAGLMAAEVARAAGAEVDLYERMGSVGRKFLLAGKGGLNLTHGEAFPSFVTRYRSRAGEVGGWLQDFDADALRAWAAGLGVETFVGTSGRVFPKALKAAPLLRAWVRRLRAQGVRFHVQHRWLGLGPTAEGAFRLRFGEGSWQWTADADAVVLALGGASWPQLGSDGAWTETVEDLGAGVTPLVPANCGFDVAWSDHFATKFAGQPLKPVVLHWSDTDGVPRSRRGELIVTATGIEGSLAYAASADLREGLARTTPLIVHLDLVPEREAGPLAEALGRPRKGRSIGEHLRRSVGLDGVRAALVHERVPKDLLNDAEALAARIKSLPIALQRTRPLAEAISTAGGVRLESLDDALMIRARPRVYCAGEMLDWEAPTGGYLLAASFASGLRAGRAAATAACLASADRT